METRTYNVYAWDELSDEAKQKTLNRYWDINVNFDWWEFIIDSWKKKLAAIGFINVNIRYSGFNSQGDGASFTADIDYEKFFNYIIYCTSLAVEARKYEIAALLADKNILDIELRRKPGYLYVHENSVETIVRTHFNNDYHYYWCSLCDFVQDGVEELRMNLSQTIYFDLRREYEYQTREEAIIETLKANDYMFTKDGEID